MDPEVRQDHPGSCPKCGMALEPDLSTVPQTASNTPARCTRRSCSDAPGACPICGMALEPRTRHRRGPPNPELDDMTRRLWLGLVLGLPVFVLDDGRHGAGHGARRPPRHAADATGSAWSSRRPVVLWAGWPFFERGWASIVNRTANMFTLIALGVGAAYLFSVAGTLAPDIFPDGFRDPRRRRNLLRHRGRDHRPGAARPGAGAARAQPDERGDPRSCSAWRRRRRA